MKDELPGVACALDLEAIENHQHEDAEGHAGGDVDIGGGHDLEVDVVGVHAENVLAEQLGGVGNQVDRDEIHQVHQEHPHENGEGEGTDHLAVAMETVPD